MPTLPHPRRIIDAKYLRFVRSKGCVLNVPANPCTDATDAHHVKPVGGGIMGSKVSDRRAVGLCRLHHQMAELYPSSHRETLEREIKKLNKEYDALYPVTPKAKRQVSPKLFLEVRHCPCGQTHTIPMTRVVCDEISTRFWCSRNRLYVEVPA